MAYNEELTLRIREALAEVAVVEEKKMFRGVAFMVNGKLCITAGDSTLMCRIDPGIYEEAIKQTGARPVIMKGRQYKGYVYVDAEGFKTKRQLMHWVNLALDYNARAKATAKRNKKALARNQKK